jgi:hypothetical protein
MQTFVASWIILHTAPLLIKHLLKPELFAQNRDVLLLLPFSVSIASPAFPDLYTMREIRRLWLRCSSVNENVPLF